MDTMDDLDGVNVALSDAEAEVVRVDVIDPELLRCAVLETEDVRDPVVVLDAEDDVVDVLDPVPVRDDVPETVPDRVAVTVRVVVVDAEGLRVPKEDRVLDPVADSDRVEKGDREEIGEALEVRLGLALTLFDAVVETDFEDVVDDVLVRVPTLDNVTLLEAEAERDIVDVLELVDDPVEDLEAVEVRVDVPLVVEVSDWRAVRVDVNEGRGLCDANAERVAVRVELDD